MIIDPWTKHLRDKERKKKAKAWRKKKGLIKPKENKKPKKPRPKPLRKDFYSSWEWKAVRYESLKLHGRQCLCCGFTPRPESKNYLVVDHIKPASKFPELALDIKNTQVFCNDCNMGKSNVHYDDFRRY